MQGYNKPNATTYVNYDDIQAVNKLDLNIWGGNINYSGKHLYQESSVYGAIGLCSPSRNPDVHYISGVERPLGDHPDHSSRFGYGRCSNGYCSGVQAGLYVMPPDQQFDPQPQGVAPKRFYTQEYQGRNRVNTQASVDYNNFSSASDGPFIY